VKFNNTITQDFKEVIQNACPGAGACGGMYNSTMSSAIEAGMSLP
jgi:dihydroxy-acid dehydratase